MAELEEIITAEIRKNGPIPFVRFMELALYCPVYGYYEAEGDKIGRRGDYYTSVSVGSLFGELLARQFVEWARTTGPFPDTLEIWEAGAHQGDLAKDILDSLQTSLGEEFSRTYYTILEPSMRRRTWQEKTLAGFRGRVCWSDTLTGAGTQPRGGGPLFRIIFCNELLDAMPVHRVTYDARKGAWFEWGVAAESEGFHWVPLPSITEAGAKALDRVFTSLGGASDPLFRSQLEAVLPEAYTVELCPVAEAWWREAADSITVGKLMGIDYGLSAGELFRPERKSGTLRSYRTHQASLDVLANPGRQDLTAHVVLPLLQDAGESCGLRTEQLSTQERFLTQIAARSDPSLVWTSDRKRQFATLTHPEHLGTRFRVLVQEKVARRHGPDR